jgi:hypothetical protein
MDPYPVNVLLHDLGAISMICLDSQAMGRVGETIVRTWQTAHVMAAKRAGDGNERLRCYVAKYTICPAVADRVGPLQRNPRRLSSSTSSAVAAVTKSGPVGISSPRGGNSRCRARSASMTTGR